MSRPGDKLVDGFYVEQLSLFLVSWDRGVALEELSHGRAGVWQSTAVPAAQAAPAPGRCRQSLCGGSLLGSLRDIPRPNSLGFRSRTSA